VREPNRWVGGLRRVTFARAVQGSNSIEGYNATLDDAVAAVDGEQLIDANSETALAVAGYRDAMTYSFSSPKTTSAASTKACSRHSTT
jgi:hypothetical protein